MTLEGVNCTGLVLSSKNRIHLRRRTHSEISGNQLSGIVFHFVVLLTMQLSCSVQYCSGVWSILQRDQFRHGQRPSRADITAGGAWKQFLLWSSGEILQNPMFNKWLFHWPCLIIQFHLPCQKNVFACFLLFCLISEIGWEFAKHCHVWSVCCCCS